MNIKNFMPVSCAHALKAFCLGGALLTSTTFLAGTAHAQFNFAGAHALSGEWGTVTNDNTGATPDTGAPAIAGFSAHAPLWYSWQAPYDGEVEMDTVGTAFPLDTVLGVYTGTDLAHLNQLAANDDLYPINSLGLDLISPLAEYGGPVEILEPNSTNDFFPPEEFATPGYYGPSHLRFNAVGGQTYYFAVDTKRTAGFSLNPVASTGNVQLNWAYKSSGVFRFASEDFDPMTGLPLYQTSQTESQPPLGPNNQDRFSLIKTYYSYNAPGVLVTVTRAAGSKGRALVNYQTVDGTNLASAVDMPGLAFTDYMPVSGQLVFDDFEMSKTILIPIFYNAIPGDQTNRVFGIQLVNDGGVTSPTLDLYESPDVSAPRVDPVYSTAVVRILNQNGDPYGPDMVSVVSTNGFDTNNSPILVTNLEVALFPTNNVFNFTKANYRVPADLTDTNIYPYNYVNITLYVARFGTNTSAETIHYRLNSMLDDDTGPNEGNNMFPLQPGSDYAVPLPANQTSTIRNYTNTVYDGVSTNYDFDAVDGTLSFAAGRGVDAMYQPLHINIPVSRATKFNKDFRLQLYREVKVGNDTVPEMTGNNSEATITILFNDANPPAGSVDEFYNPDFYHWMAILGDGSSLPDRSEPGVGGAGNPGVVNAIAINPLGEAFIGGSFQNYNNNNGSGSDQNQGQTGLALVDSTGQLDLTFNSGFGLAGDITGDTSTYGKAYAVAVWRDKYYIAGNFTTYNKSGAGCVARLNADGSLDTSFSSGSNPGGNTGANGTIRAIAVLPNGELMVGGDFTQINGTPCNYLALLNTNGDVDTSFNPGATISGPVYSLALNPGHTITVTGNAFNTNEYDAPINLGGFTAGTATINFNLGTTTTNDLRLYYGGLNGRLLFDTGWGTGAGVVTVPFAPMGAFSTNLLTVVMDQGGGPVGADWSFSAAVTVGSTNLAVVAGGNFSIANETYQNIARLNGDGSLDTTFQPATGANGIVHAVAWQADGKIVAGGEFTVANGQQYNHIVRYNADGSVDPAFAAGSGADDVVYSINVQPNGTMYVGGAFQTFNGTRRSGFTRLYADGTVDTTFMDTAYNQFAGIKKILSTDAIGVFASAVQADGNILIGGSFLQIGGGQAYPGVCNSVDDDLGLEESFGDPYLWVEPKTRDGVRNRIGFARLIGGATPGPGNVGLIATTYSQTKDKATEPIGLTRYNGHLGPVSANFSVAQATALAGQDYSYQANEPIFWIAWEYLGLPTWQRADGLSGASGALIDPLGLPLSLADADVNTNSTVTMRVMQSRNNPGNLSAKVQLANPSLAETFYLGGEPIPLGTALGTSSAQLSLIDINSYPGQFGFISPIFTATNNPTILTLVRSNTVSSGTVAFKLNTVNGTALAGTDYQGITNLTVNFNTSSGIITNPVVIKYQSSTLPTEKTFTVKLSGGVAGATYGISNAIVRIINPDFAGFVTLDATNYSGAIQSGVLNFTVNRTVGSLGSVTVQYATSDGTAVNGVDYLGSTNTLRWNSGDVSPRVVSIPLINSGLVGANKQFGVRLFNPTTASLGPIPNATLVISNNNYYGALQLTASSYTVREDGGYATITAVRTGGAVGTVSANFATSDGTALKNVNYVPTNGVLVLAPNQTSASFNVAVINAGDTNPIVPYFNVTLSNPTNATLGSPAAAQVVITETANISTPPGSPDLSFQTNNLFNGSVLSLSLQPDGKILAGGDFTAVGPILYGRLARLNPDGSLDSTFLNRMAGANSTINDVVCQTDGRILVGGNFSTVNNNNVSYLTRLMVDGSVDSTFGAGLAADNVVNAIAEDFTVSGTNSARIIYVGGAFITFNGVTTPGVARLFDSGVVDASFGVGFGADGPVYALAVYPTNTIYAGKVLVGGMFNHFNGFAYTNLVRLNFDGSVDTNFTANLGGGPNGAVRALAVQTGGQILVGGSFTSFNGLAAGHLVRLNPDGTADAVFSTAIGTGADDIVDAIMVQPDNRVCVAGQFVNFNGSIRHGITRLMPTGAADYSINFGAGANGTVDALVQQSDGSLLIGGAFTAFNNQPYPHIVRIYGGSTTVPGGFTFAAARFFVNEDGLLGPVTILRTGNTGGPNPDGSGLVSVHFATADGTAVAGTNYLPVSTDVTFAPGQVEQSVAIPVLDDFVLMTNPATVMLTLTNPTPPLTVVGQSFAELDILNTDNSVCFSNAYPWQYKNAPSGLAPVNVLRLGGLNNTSTVEFYTVTNGTAVIGADYYPTNGTVTFLPGQSLAQAYVPIINNPFPEGNRTVGLALTNASNFNLGISDPSNAMLTIIDTVTNAGQVFFPSTNYDATSGDGTAYLTVMRTNINAFSPTITVDYTLVPITAMPGVDYRLATNVNVQIFKGDATAQIAVTLLTNSLVRGTVALGVYLSNPSGGATLTYPTNAILYILNTNVGFSFQTATNYVRETNGEVAIFVQRLGAPNSPAQVSYSTVPGTAQPGVNYTPISGTLNFAANETLKSISLPLLDDPQVTGNRFLTMKLGNLSSGTQYGAISNAMVVIQDADAGISFTNAVAYYSKSVGVAYIPVVCTNTAVEPVLVDTNIVPMMVRYATADGTALAGLDYSATNGILYFTNGIGTNYITVPILDNTRVTGDHAFTVNLFNPTAPGQLVPPSSQTVNIQDFNVGMSFSSPVYSVLKDAVVAPITVVRSDFIGTNSGIQFATQDGTAQAGLDYVATNGLLSFTNGEVSKTFNVTLLANTSVQPDKTVLLQLSNPTNGLMIAPYAATLTIHDTSGSLVVPAGSTLIHESLVTNGIIDPGETVTLMIGLRASGGLNVTNLNATLVASNGVSSPSGAQKYGTLIVEGPSVSKPFTFTAQGTNSQVIFANFLLDNGVTNLGVATFTYTLGSWTNTFYNTNTIFIRDNTMASPYPSAITVSNLGGVLVKSTVTFSNLTHGYTKDIESLLVSPAGADALLMSHAGNGSVTKINLTFDDAATNFLSATNVLVTGTNRPSSYPPTTIFP